MKKILTKIALVSALVASAQAGAILDIEVGGGQWSTKAPTGGLDVGVTAVDFTTDSALTKTSGNAYAWAVIDHAIPVIPNIRFEQTTLKSSGLSSVDFLGYTNDVKSELDMSNSDIIAYWGLPFASWAPFIDELDIGLGGKTFNGAFTITETLTSNSSVQSFDGAMIPYLYAKLRIEPPFMMGIGLEAELKNLSVDVGSIVASFTETIVKADWGLDAPLPLLDIEAGIEVGYRATTLDVEITEMKGLVEFNGIFFGVYGKFGI